MYETKTEFFTPRRSVFYIIKTPSTLIWRAFHLLDLISLQHRPELISVYLHTPLIAIFADLAGDHLHTLTGAGRHADARLFFAQVSQLRGERVIPV